MKDLKSLIFWCPEKRFPPSLHKRELLGWKPTLGAPPVARFAPRKELRHQKTWTWVPSPNGKEDPYGGYEEPGHYRNVCSCEAEECCEEKEGTLCEVEEARWSLQEGWSPLETYSADGLLLVWEGKVCRTGVEHALWWLAKQIHPAEWAEPTGVLEIAQRLRELIPTGKIVLNGEALP